MVSDSADNMVSDKTNQVSNTDQVVLENTTNQFVLNSADQMVSDPADQMVLDIPQQLALVKSGTVGTPLESKEHPLQDSSESEDIVTHVCFYSDPSSESELDSEDDNIHVQEFWANCMREPEGVSLKRCTRCLLSFCCSVKCQREKWKDHKLACSLVAV